MSDMIPITANGYEKIKEELRKLRTVERQAVIAEIAEARSHGDLSENAEYHSAREKQSFIEFRIADLDAKLSRLQVIQPGDPGPTDKVVFGSVVVLREISDEGDKGEQKKYRIVGELEADLKNNAISITSPVARSLLNKEIGDIVAVNVPRGVREYEIVSIAFE